MLYNSGIPEWNETAFIAALFPAAVIVAIGWSIRYVLSGRTSV
jgi:hypothetical protein